VSAARYPDGDEIKRREEARMQREHARHGDRIALADLIAAAGAGGELAALARALMSVETEIRAGATHAADRASSRALDGARLREDLAAAGELVAHAAALAEEARASRKALGQRALKLGIPAAEVARIAGVERNTAQVWKRELGASRPDR
jgi:hypothetical protein